MAPLNNTRSYIDPEPKLYPPPAQSQFQVYAPDRHIEQVGDRLLYELSTIEIVLLCLLVVSVVLNIVQQRLIVRILLSIKV